MFGYICVNEQELKLREYTAYRSYYCGLCRNLHHRYGRIAQMMLNYDLTFVAMLLTGLYEPETEGGQYRCLLHPMVRHQAVQNDAIDYAADMCVLLSYQKLKDDWMDEHRRPQRAAAVLLRKAYLQVAEKYPRQRQAVERSIRLLRRAEEQNRRDIDYVAGLTGRFLAEIFNWRDDIWRDDLRRMGFFLGKFIYLMDALEDVKKDQKHNNYNLFSEYGTDWKTTHETEIRDMLSAMMMEASRAFERLPVLENAEILRNILYSGVWCKYALLQHTEEEKVKSRKCKGEV